MKNPRCAVCSPFTSLPTVVCVLPSYVRRPISVPLSPLLLISFYVRSFESRTLDASRKIRVFVPVTNRISLAYTTAVKRIDRCPVGWLQHRFALGPADLCSWVRPVFHTVVSERIHSRWPGYERINKQVYPRGR